MTQLPAARVKVWDRAVRLLHWTLVLAVALAWISTEWGGGAHQPAGYVALAAVLLRAAWGLGRSGSGGYARFAQFVRGPRRTLHYAVQVLQHREPRHVGHNPLGGWMVLALMGCVAGLGLTGWAYTSDWLWGDARVEALHIGLAWTLLGLAALHVAGVVFTSRRHRENLLRAMLDGRKRAPRGSDVA